MTQGQSQVKLFRIAEFAKIALTTPRALRLWQRMGLLEPYQQDKWTGYRYYHINQIETVMQIKWWQELGLGLRAIRQRREDRIKVEAYIKKLEEEIKSLQAKRNFVIRFSQFLKTNKPQLTKVRVGGWRLLTKKIKKGKYYEIGKYVKELWNKALQFDGLEFRKAEITFYETPYFSPAKSDLKLGLIIKKGRINEDRLLSDLQIENYPKQYAYRFKFVGPYRFLMMVYRKLNWYFITHKVPIYPPVFEVYTKGPFNTKNEYDYVTEIYYPVEK